MQTIKRFANNVGVINLLITIVVGYFMFQLLMFSIRLDFWPWIVGAYAFGPACVLAFHGPMLEHRQSVARALNYAWVGLLVYNFKFAGQLGLPLQTELTLEGAVMSLYMSCYVLIQAAPSVFDEIEELVHQLDEPVVAAKVEAVPVDDDPWGDRHRDRSDRW